MATIYDVAKHAKVSPKTVSRVLNGEGPVKQSTRDAVMKAMEEIRYVPSLAARSIKSQKSGLLGLITGAISTGVDSQDNTGLPDLLIVQGIQHIVERSGKTLLISDTGGRPDSARALIRTFREHRVEGLIYVADFHKQLEEALPVGDIPTVLVNCYDDHDTPSVLPDDEQGQYLLTSKVVEAGHSRIAYLSLGASFDATRLRLKGFKRALTAAGVTFDPALSVPVDMFTPSSAQQLIWDAIDRFLKLPEPPTAICCGNDRLAMVVYGILRERGLSVPEQMSVIGYDDHKLISEALYPSLTTAELPYSAMGARAAQLMLDMIGDPTFVAPNDPLLVSGQVRKRNSLTGVRNEMGTLINLSGRKQK